MAGFNVTIGGQTIRVNQGDSIDDLKQKFEKAGANEAIFTNVDDDGNGLLDTADNIHHFKFNLSERHYEITEIEEAPQPAAAEAKPAKKSQDGKTSQDAFNKTISTMAQSYDKDKVQSYFLDENDDDKHTVKRGDNLTKIAKKALEQEDLPVNNKNINDRIAQIVALNGIKNANEIAVGQKLIYTLSQEGIDRVKANDGNSSKALSGTITPADKKTKPEAVEAESTENPEQPAEATAPAEEAEGTEKAEKTEGTEKAEKTEGTDEAAPANGKFKADDLTADIEPATVTTKEPTKPDSTYPDKIIKNQESGFDLAKQISDINQKFCESQNWDNREKYRKLLEQITPENVSYVLDNIPDLADLIDGVDLFIVKQGGCCGFDKDEVFKYVLDNLQKRAARLGVKDRGDDLTKGASLEDMKTRIGFLSKKIRNFESAVVKKYKNELTQYTTAYAAYKKEVNEVNEKNATLGRAQEYRNRANQLLAELANMNQKPNITQETKKVGEKTIVSKATLEYQGNKVVASYINDGSLGWISVVLDGASHNNENASDQSDVEYIGELAFYDAEKDGADGKKEYLDEFGGKIDANKLKEFAEAIFGKLNQE